MLDVPTALSYAGCFWFCDAVLGWYYMLVLGSEAGMHLKMQVNRI